MTALNELDEAIGWVFELAEEREDLELIERLSDLESAYRKLESVKAAVWDEGAEAVWDRDGFLPYSIRRQNPYRKEQTDE